MRSRVVALILTVTLIMGGLPTCNLRAETLDMEMTQEQTEQIIQDQMEQLLEDVLLQTEDYQDSLGFNESMNEWTDEEKGEFNTSGLTEEIENDPILYAQWKESITTGSSIELNFSRMSSLNGNHMTNEYMGIVIANNGRISLGTTGGNPDSRTDDYKKLTYGYPGGTTSFTTIRIDGVDYYFTANQGTQFDPDGSRAISTMNIGDVIVQQVVTFDVNMTTGRDDMARIKYIVTNAGTESHSIGIRIMLDTMLSSNDGVPFRVPGYGNVTTEIELSGSRIPQYWQAFDNLDAPTIIANGSFYKSINEKPDKVQFTAWPGIMGTTWDYTINPNRMVTGDSAVAMYYNPEEVVPGATRSVETYYGIGEFFTGEEDQSSLALSLTAPRTMIVNPQTGNYESNPFTVTAYIRNNSNAIVRDVKATLSLPSSGELSLVGDTVSTKSVGDIAPREEKTVTYRVLASSQRTDKVVNGSVKLTSSNSDEQSAKFDITLPKAIVSKDGSITLNKTQLILEKGKNETLIPKLTNLTGTVTWISDNPAVATVNASGKVTAKAVGRANIKASCGGRVTTCSVTVTGSDVKIQTMYFSPSSINLDIKKTISLQSFLRFNPSNPTNQKIKSWKSSNVSVATVSNGVVYGVKSGTATITAVSEDGGAVAVCNINVVEPEPELGLGTAIKFNTEVNGPIVNFANTSFPLFTLPVGTEIKLGDKVKLVYNDANDKYVAYFGDVASPAKTNDKNPNGTLTEEAKQLRKDAYKTIKGLMNKVGKQTNREFYNGYRSLIKKNGPMAIIGDKSIFGYVEFTRTSTGYALGAGEICVLFTAGVDLKYKFPPAPVVYIKFGITGSLQSGLKAKMIEAGNLSKGVDISGEVSLAVKPGVGVGGDIGVAKVEAGLEGEIKGTLNFRPHLNPTFSAPRDLKLNLKSTLYLSYKAFIFINGKKTWEIGNFAIYPQANVRRLTSPVASIGLGDLEVIPRSYADNPSYFVANRQARAYSLDATIEHRSMKTNVYPYGETQLVEFEGGKCLLVWIDNDSSRLVDENSAALYYTYFDGSMWSSPQQVENDGTADFAPYLIKVGNTPYLAWQNSEKVYHEGVSLSEVTESIGISVAKFENGIFTTSKITQPDSMIESAPIVATNGTNVSVVWSKNSENDIFGTQGINSMYRSSLVEDSWHEPIEVHSDVGVIGEVTAAYYNNDLFIAYSKDKDRNLDTVDDKEIMLIKGTSAPYNLTQNEIADLNPKLVNNNGRLELYWYADGVIYYMQDMLGTSVETIESSVAIGMNFDVLSNNSEKVILWEQSDGFNSNLYGIFYDKVQGKWGDTIQLTEQENRIRESDAFIGNDGNIYISYISASVLGNPTEEDSPFGECNLMITKLVPSYDLRVQDSILFDEELIYDGSELMLGIHVENIGQKTVESIMINILKDGEIIQSEDLDVMIASGVGEYIEIPYYLDDPFEAHEISVEVLPKGNIDNNMNNNKVYATIGEAVIQVGDISISGSGSSRIVTASLNNTGYLQCAPLLIQLIRSDGETEQIISNSTVETILGNSVYEVTFDLPINHDEFAKDSTTDTLVYVRVFEQSTNQQISQNFVELLNPYYGEYLTISNVALVGNTIILNIDNNLPETVEGLLCIEHIEENESSVLYGQEIVVDALYGESMQLDLSSIDIENGDLYVYVEGENSWVISNEVMVNGINTAKARKPQAIPKAGVYERAQLVTLNAPDEGSTIYYTTDGSDPTAGSLVYTEPINVEDSMTIKVIAVHEELLDSEVGTYTYVISPPMGQVERPTSSLTSGLYTSVQQAILSCSTEGATIYYTTDGSIPTEESNIYTQPIIVDKSMTLRMIATKEDMISSEDVRCDYIIDIAKQDKDQHPSQDNSPTYSSSSSSEKVKNFVEQFKTLTKTQRTKVLEYLPYTVLSWPEDISYWNSITNGYFTKAQLQEITKSSKEVVGFLQNEGWSYKTVELTKNNKVDFTDVSDKHWAKASIEEATAKGFVGGFTDGTFKPSQPLTVSDTLTFLDRILLTNNRYEVKLSRQIVEKYFTDKQHWAFYNMCSVGSKLSEDTLKVLANFENEALPREVVAEILFEVTDGKLIRTESGQTFVDVEDSKFKEAIYYCVETGLLKGVGSNTMAPKKSVTRAEMISIIIRLDNFLKQNTIK